MQPLIENPVEGIEVIVEDKWTNVQVDSQLMALFMACPTKYNYKFNRHLSIVGGENDGIRRGSIIHDALLAYWRYRIANPEQGYQTASELCVAKAKEGLNKDLKFELDFKLETLQQLIEFLKHLSSQSWIPLEVEKYFKIKAYEDPEMRLRIFLVGRIDLIIRLPQIPILPIDMKTEAEKWFYSAMGNQFKIYNIACGTNLLGVQRVGFQKTVKNDERFKLETIAFDPDILEEYRTVTLPHYVKQMLIAAEDNFYPMNLTNCISGHFSCEYSDKRDHKGICSVSRSIREQKLGRYFVVGPEWDPSRVDE